VNYDEIDPDEYEKRYDLIPRENYMKVHWRPAIEECVRRYCRKKEVLDLGCGYGRYTIPIKECCSSVFGLDISQRWLNYLRRENNVLDVVRADAHNIPFRDESFDVVVSIGLFEYVKRSVVLREISRVLKADGYCIISVPNRRSAIRMTSRLISRIVGAKYPADEPTRREMLNLFSENRFMSVEERMDDGLIWLPDFADKAFGKAIYKFVERIFRPLGKNPFSNNMLYIIRKTHG
jgi:SAM-dependent methyltransferase